MGTDPKPLLVTEEQAEAIRQLLADWSGVGLVGSGGLEVRRAGRTISLALRDRKPPGEVVFPQNNTGGGTGNLTLLFAKTSSADTVITNGSFATVSTAFGLAAGDVLKFTAYGTIIGGTEAFGSGSQIYLNVDGVTLVAGSIYPKFAGGETRYWCFHGEILFPLMAAGVNNSYIKGGSTFLISVYSGADVNSSPGVYVKDEPMTQVGLIAGTATAYLSVANGFARTVTLNGFTMERLSP